MSDRSCMNLIIDDGAKFDRRLYNIYKVRTFEQTVREMFTLFGELLLVNQSDSGEFVIIYTNENDAMVASQIIANVVIAEDYPNVLYYYPTKMYNSRK